MTNASMSMRNIEDVRKVMFNMKFAADALRNLHNESTQEEVEKAHAEHDVAKNLYQLLIRGEQS